MTKQYALHQDIIQEVKTRYEVVLESFRLYETPQELVENEGQHLSIVFDEMALNTFEEETNVFKGLGKWIYADAWYDAEWDD